MLRESQRPHKWKYVADCGGCCFGGIIPNCWNYNDMQHGSKYHKNKIRANGLNTICQLMMSFWHLSHSKLLMCLICSHHFMNFKIQITFLIEWIIYLHRHSISFAPIFISIRFQITYRRIAEDPVGKQRHQRWAKIFCRMWKEINNRKKLESNGILKKFFHSFLLITQIIILKKYHYHYNVRLLFKLILFFLN